MASAKYCYICNGRGGFRDGFNRWHKCKCVSGNPKASRVFKKVMEGQQQLDMLKATNPAAYTEELRRQLYGK